MTDITMCLNYDCPSKGYCYRFMALPDPHGGQSYMKTTPARYDKPCELFVPMPDSWKSAQKER